jgi:amidase
MIDVEDYLGWDGLEMAARVRRGEVSADELEATCRTLIDRLDPTLNAIGDLAEPVPHGAPDGVFAGVPFAVKELLAAPGLPWTMGSRLLAAHPPGEPTPYLRRLLDSGLRIVCSTTSSEFGLLGSTESALRGATHNPWRPGLSAGGSSGGSAAAVAAGIVPLAHASDAGGSIRIPAAMTGLFGFKPSHQRCVPTVPADGGLGALVVDHCVSRTVRDSAALLEQTERRGPDARYPLVGGVPGAGRARLRIATITTSLCGGQPDPAVRDAVERTRALCAELGHRIVELEPLPIDGAALSDAFFTTAALTLAQLADLMTPVLGRRPGPAELEPFTLELIDWSATLPPDSAQRAAQALRHAGDTFVTAFETCDVVLSPTLTTLPWSLGTLDPALGREELIERTERLVGYTPIHNAAGCPAMSVPLGWVEGLPVGIHFAAAPGADRTLLELAFELEAARPWAHRRPRVEAVRPDPATVGR